jgi:hypothetical protein
MNAKIAQHVDVFTVSEVEGDPAIVTLPNTLGAPGTEWEGSALYGTGFITDLIQYAVEHGVVTPDQVHVALVKGQQAQAAPKRRVSISWEEFERLSKETDDHLALVAFDHTHATRN